MKKLDLNKKESWRKEIIWLRSPFVTCQYPEGFRWLTSHPKPRVEKFKGDKFGKEFWFQRSSEEANRLKTDTDFVQSDWSALNWECHRHPTEQSPYVIWGLLVTQRSSCVTIKKAKCSLRGKRTGRFHFTVLASVEDVEGLCCKPKYRADIIHHFILVCCLHFFYLFSCRKDQFTVLILKFDIEDFTDPGLLKIQLTLTFLSLWFLS